MSRMHCQPVRALASCFLFLYFQPSPPHHFSFFVWWARKRLSCIESKERIWSILFISIPFLRSQTLNGPFSALSTPIFAVKYSLENCWRDLVNSTIFSFPPSFKNLNGPAWAAPSRRIGWKRLKHAKNEKRNIGTIPNFYLSFVYSWR